MKHINKMPCISLKIENDNSYFVENDWLLRLFDDSLVPIQQYTWEAQWEHISEMMHNTENYNEISETKSCNKKA